MINKKDVDDLNKFIASFPRELIFENEPMKNHSSFCAGGNASLMFIPDTVQSLIQAVQLCLSDGLNYYIVGNCTNLLVRDCGFEGVIIKLGSKLSKAETEASGDSEIFYLRAQAGALLSDLSMLAMEEGLTGLEFASGIPGTLGGAVYMNAGAYNGEIKDVVVSVDVMSKDGSIITLSNSQLNFGYRTSTAQKDGHLILSAVLALKKGDKTAIKNRIDELTELRKQKQPLDLPSAGSTFKRPKGFYAGKLISDAGLRGFSIGGAQVSEKHAGFIVNFDNATSDDIVKLIEHVVLTVKEKFGCALEPEVRIIP